MVDWRPLKEEQLSSVERVIDVLLSMPWSGRTPV